MSDQLEDLIEDIDIEDISSIKRVITNKDIYNLYYITHGITLLYMAIYKLVAYEIEQDVRDINLTEEIKKIIKVIKYFIGIGIDTNIPNRDGNMPIYLLVRGSKYSLRVLEFLISNGMRVPFDIYRGMTSSINPDIKAIIKKYLDNNRLVEFYKVTVQGIPLNIREMIYNLFNYENILEILQKDIDETEDDKSLYLKKFNYSKIEQEANRIIQQLKYLGYYDYYNKVKAFRSPKVMKGIADFLYGRRRSRKGRKGRKGQRKTNKIFLRILRNIDCDK